jgi:hypothetical protein
MGPERETEAPQFGLKAFLRLCELWHFLSVLSSCVWTSIWRLLPISLQHILWTFRRTLLPFLASASSSAKWGTGENEHLELSYLWCSWISLCTLLASCLAFSTMDSNPNTPTRALTWAKSTITQYYVLVFPPSRLLRTPKAEDLSFRVPCGVSCWCCFYRKYALGCLWIPLLTG